MYLPLLYGGGTSNTATYIVLGKINNTRFGTSVDEIVMVGGGGVKSFLN